MKINEAVSIRIRELLSEKKMSQYKLEQISGITHNTMLCIMNGRYESCYLKTILKIIHALELTPSEFFSSNVFDFSNLKM